MIQVGVQAVAGEKVWRCLVLDFQAGGTWLRTARAAWEVAAESVRVFGARVRNKISSHGQYLSQESESSHGQLFFLGVLSCH